ncbi:MAG: phospholipase D-like domain-containing protein [Saprospiraceae bacterium]
MKFTNKNQIEFLPSGVSSYSFRWALLQNAKESIHLTTFSFMKDETTKRLFELLKEKKKEGVQIRIIYDDIVNRTTFVGGWLRELKDIGIELYGYNSLLEGWWIKKKKGRPFQQIMLNIKLKLKQHYHEKYFIVDNEHLILGGINWGNKYAFGGLKPKAWRDTDVYIRGELVEKVQLQFLSDYEMQKEWKEQRWVKYQDFVLSYLPTYNDQKAIMLKYPDFFGQNTYQSLANIKIAYVAHKPYDRNEIPLTNIFLSLIKSAKKRIYWGCHGVRPPKIFCEYFAAAAKRGVEVVLITNSKKSAKTLMLNGLLGWMYNECSKHYKYLVENGIRLFEWQKEGAFHSKNLIIDDDVVSIGSYNIANGSAFHHSESNIIVKDKTFCKKVFKQFEIDLMDCKEVTFSNFKFPKANAFDRIIHERNNMIHKDLLTDDIQKDLSSGNYKKFPLYEFVDIS